MARSLARSPGFTAAAVITLALGIGANAALFSILDALLLSSLPVSRPHELFVLSENDYSYPSFLRFRQRSDLFTNMFASSGVTPADVRIDDRPVERGGVSLVSGSFFETLGIPAVLGRTFGPLDDRIGGTPVAVASYGFWQRYFALSPDAVGRAISVNRATVTIVGIAPRAFFGERVGAAPDLWIPLTMWSQIVPGRDLVNSRNTAWLQIIGRLAPGVTPDRAAAALTLDYRLGLTESFGPRIPDDVRPFIARAAVRVVPAARGVSSLREEYRRPVQLLMGAVGLVLLVACANLANMLLIRGLSRRRAIGIQLAMGISRWRLIRSVLSETALFTALGAALSVPVAHWTSQLLLTLISEGPGAIPLQVSLNWRVLTFTGFVSLATTLIVGVMPAIKAARVDVLAVLKPAPSSGGRPAGHGSVLLTGQVTCAVVLLVCAALLARTFANLHASDLGFATERLVVVDVDPRTAGYRGETYRALVTRTLERLKVVPGVASVTQTENGVLAGRDSSTDRMRPAAIVKAEGLPQMRFDVVGPDYFQTLGIRILAGRDFRAADQAASGRVMAVNETMARHYFGDRDALGQQMLWRDGLPWEIVAVVADVKQTGPRSPKQLRFYIPYTQHDEAELASARFVVRTPADPGAMSTALRQAVALEDRALTVGAIDSADQLLDRVLTRDRAVSIVASLFGLLAAAIAALGLYATLGYQVARRRSELSLRSAIGARPMDLARLVMSDSARIVALGSLFGVAGAVGASRLLTSLLFGLSPIDVFTYVAVVTVLAAVAFAASYGPARQAARTEPLMSLRAE